jgi:hypothetical protein
MKQYLRPIFSLVVANLLITSTVHAQSSYSRKVEAKPSNTEITAKAGSTFAEKKLHRQLHRTFKRYAEALGTEVFGQEEFLRMAGRAENNAMLRKDLLDDYLMVLQDEVASKMENADSRTVREAMKSLEDDFNRTRKQRGGEQRLLDQYVLQETQNFNRDLDQLYRDMILELESKGHFELARLFIDLKARGTQSNPKDDFSALMSIAKENVAHLELDQRIQNAGGIDAFKQELKIERKQQLNWKCVNAKIAVSAALVPLTATTMFLGYHAAPLVAGYLTLKTTGSMIGSYGMLKLTSAAVKKVIKGCYREIHTRESIDGLMELPETGPTEEANTK